MIRGGEIRPFLRGRGARARAQLAFPSLPQYKDVDKLGWGGAR